METILAALRAAGEPTRLRLLALLGRAELTVTELTQILGQSQPRVSRHLRLLCEAGLIDRFSEGTWAFYRLTGDQEGARVGRRLIELLPGDDDTLARDVARLEKVKTARAEAAAEYFRASAGDWDHIRSLHVPGAEVERAIMRILGDGDIGDVLDVGTGTGRMLELLSPRMRHGIGIDQSREMLAVARASLDEHDVTNAQVRQGDMYHVALADGSIDVAVFHLVLHYADNPGAAVAEAARVLRPGGSIVIVDFAPHDLEFLRTEHAHRRLGFADDEVVGWCAAAGLTAAPECHLEGRDLNVTIWLARKQAATLAVADAAR